MWTTDVVQPYLRVHKSQSTLWEGHATPRRCACLQRVAVLFSADNTASWQCCSSAACACNAAFQAGRQAADTGCAVPCQVGMNMCAPHKIQGRIDRDTSMLSFSTASAGTASRRLVRCCMLMYARAQAPRPTCMQVRRTDDGPMGIHAEYMASTRLNGSAALAALPCPALWPPCAK